MNLNETVNFSATINLKDEHEADAAVAYLNATLDGQTQNLTITVNVVNKILLNTADAVDVAGETAQVQYAGFEAAVKSRAKELGYKLFA